MPINPSLLKSHQGPPEAEVWLIWGLGGWIATKLADLLIAQGKTVVVCGVRMHHDAEVREVLRTYAPRNVVCAAGFTGRPNIDQCEVLKNETVEANVTGPLVLAAACRELGVHLTLFATGC